MKTFEDLVFEAKSNPMSEVMYNGRKASIDFDNYYGVSVIDGFGAYCEEGTFEIAIIHDGYLCYSTPITDDVIGHQTPEEVTEIMRQIQELSVNSNCSHKHKC